MDLDFKKLDGLVPAVIQDAGSGEVLMLGFMNSEAYAATQACTSRSQNSGSATDPGQAIAAPAERDAKPPFERGDIHADGRLALVELELRRGEAAGLDNCGQNADSS